MAKSFKLADVFRKKLTSEKFGEMLVETFLTDDKQKVILNISMGNLVVEKSYQNTFDGKEQMKDFKSNFTTEDSLMCYLGL